jgi:hypothetical protein
MQQTYERSVETVGSGHIVDVPFWYRYTSSSITIGSNFTTTASARSGSVLTRCEPQKRTFAHIRRMQASMF